jgi:cation:H+ antiporter
VTNVPLEVVAFVLAAGVSLLASWVLVVRLERVGARLGLAEGLLGMLAALAADAPELTTSLTALLRHQHDIGAGVVLGSNLFNLAALLGLGALVAGGISLHRRVVLFSGSVALFVALVTLLTVVGVLPAAAGLVLGLAAAGSEVAVLATHRRLARRLPRAVGAWLDEAVIETEEELLPAIHPRRGQAADVLAAVVAVVVVVGASVVMEHAASSVGARAGVPEILVGGLVLAVVTSLPNAVSGIYLARRGRSAAALSTAFNSNSINAVLGLLLPGAILGLGAASSASIGIAAWYAGMTALTVVLAWAGRGLNRATGGLLVGTYLAAVAWLVATA